MGEHEEMQESHILSHLQFFLVQFLTSEVEMVREQNINVYLLKIYLDGVKNELGDVNDIVEAQEILNLLS